MSEHSEVPMKRCKSCGVPLDEVPFDPCDEHLAYEAGLPPLNLSDEDIEAYAYDEAMRTKYEDR